MTFAHPDRIPFAPGHPRESTLRRWRAEGLPDGADWSVFLHELLGMDGPEPAVRGAELGVDFRMIPQFEEKVLQHVGGHYIVQDWKGNICEISDAFDVTYLRSAKDFVTRRWIKCPIENRDDWERMKSRYAIDAPGRLPRDLARRAAGLAGRDFAVQVNFSGPFWQLREWCGFEGLCTMMIDQPDLVAEMAAFWTEFVAGLLDRILAHVRPDMIWINEDMAYKGRAMISPAMTRTFCQPSWRRWSGQARAAGVQIVGIDSDGFVHELVPIWIESGVTACDPMEVAAGNDIVALRHLHGRATAFRGGVDKRAMARGGRAIRRELERIAPVVADGGFIPGCDHGVPADVSWPAFVDYCGLLARMTGWL